MTIIPRDIFSIYLEGRRAWHLDTTQAHCPYSLDTDQAVYWLAGYRDARLGIADRFRTQ